jgi:hypothetical protein
MITLIGDVHGKYRRLHEIIREKDRYPYIVQLGDLGFDFSTLENVSSDNFKIVGGNHDNYDKIVSIPHYLGDFGYTSLNGINFFYYRGAYSIDRQYRTIGIDWWTQEQVAIEQFFKARELYREIKPDIVLTHDCPEEIAPYLLPPGSKIYQSITGWALNELFNIHQPKFWYFGHYHNSWKMTINSTNFRCLNELEVETIYGMS